LAETPDKRRSEIYLLDFEKIFSYSVFISYICFFPGGNSLVSIII